MRDYIVKSNIKINFKSTLYVNGTDKFDAEAKVERIIRDIISSNEILKSLVDSNGKIDVDFKFKTIDNTSGR